MDLTTEERITKAKIQLYETQPFFSYIVNHLTTREFSDEEYKQMKAQNHTPTMAVDAKGNLYYGKEWVSKLDDAEVKTVLAHESMHCALMHLIRVGKRNHKIWNIATDLTINTLLQQNNFQFTGQLEKGVLAEYNKYEIGKKIIDDVDKKTAEMLYNEMYDAADKLKETGWDTHIYSDEEANGKEFCGGSDTDESKWKQIITEAAYFAKQKGNLSGNMERLVEKILNKKLNWKQLLYRYITNELQHDFTYSRPSRKFISTGIYFPSTARENIKIMAAIDTSGSIGQKELSLFLGEIYKITKSFPNMSLEVVFHDTEISSKTKFNHGNLHKVLGLKATGGGGTSHKEVFEYVKKARPSILICFTDGCSDIDDCDKFTNTIFVLTDKNVKTNFGKDIYFDKSDL